LRLGKKVSQKDLFEFSTRISNGMSWNCNIFLIVSLDFYRIFRKESLLLLSLLKTQVFKNPNKFSSVLVLLATGVPIKISFSLEYWKRRMFKME